MFLTHEGRKMRDEHTRFDIKDSTFACQTLNETLKLVFGVKSWNIRPDAEDNNNEDPAQFESMINEDISEISNEEDKNNEYELDDLMASHDLLLEHIQLLVNACWNDGKYLNKLASRIIRRVRSQPGSMYQIWDVYPEKSKETLTKMLKKVYTEAVSTIDMIDTVMK